jgi:hypothetical protein
MSDLDAGVPGRAPDHEGRGRGRRAVLALAALAAVVGLAVPAAQGGDDASSIDPAWLADRLGSEAAPADVRNNLVTGALARRNQATAQWQTAVAEGDSVDPQSKPVYVVVWAAHANASDTNSQSVRSDAGRILEDAVGYPSDARDRWVPGTDGFVVLDARRKNVDGTPNPDYGKVVNFVQLPLPWGLEAEAHHMQYVWEEGQPIVAGGLYNDTTFILGVDQLPQLELKNTITPDQTPNGSVPDAYDYAGDGHFIGTYMGGPNYNYGGSPGSVVAFKPDAEKGLVIASETVAGQPRAIDSANPNGVPEPCNEEEAAPIGTCANPHGIQIRPDLGVMVTSDYGEPKMVVIDPAKADGGRFFRPTVRVWDTSDPVAPELKSVAHMSRGWRPPTTANTMRQNRGIMENAKTWPVTPEFPDTIESKGFFAGAMCGGGIFFTPDVTNLQPDSTRQWKQVWDDGISLVKARDGDVESFVEDESPCEGGAWMQVSRNNRWLFRTVSGSAPNQENLYGKSHPVKIVYNVDVEPLVRSAQDGKVDCDLGRGIDTDGNGTLDLTGKEAVRRLANGETVADCPRLLSTLTVDDRTSGGPHWGALDNHTLTTDGSPTRMVFANYFVSRSSVDGDHKMHMVDIDPATGKLTYDTTWRDEVTGRMGVDFDRSDWPGAPDAGYYKPHSMVWVCPPGVCPPDSPGVPSGP